jgi:hypothetical protein
MIKAGVMIANVIWKSAMTISGRLLGATAGSRPARKLFEKLPSTAPVPPNTSE